MRVALAALMVPLLACTPTPGVTIGKDVPDAGHLPGAGPAAIDAGSSPQPDGTLPIPSPAALSESSCRWELPAAPCPVGSGGCLMLHQRARPPRAVLTQAQLGDDTFHFVPFVSDEHLVFATYRSVDAPAGPARLLALAAQGGPLVELLSLPNNVRLDNVSGVAWDPSYALWFIDETGSGNQRNRTLRLSPGAQSGATVAYPGIPPVVTPAVAVGSDYFVAHPDGVYAYHPAGGGRLAQAQNITALAASGSDVLFADCPDRCTLFFHQRRAFSTTILASDLAGPIQSMAVHQGDVYTLSARQLLRVPLHGGAAPQVVYLGEVFPQHPGTLLASSLRAAGNQLFLEEICHPDADAPEYATVQISLDAHAARWLNLHPDFPYHPQVRPRQAWASAPWVNATGLYTWQHQ